MKNTPLLFALALSVTLAYADQQQAVDVLISEAGKSKVICNTQGHVTHLAISNHKSLKKEGRLPQTVFMENIVNLPDIEAIALERQDLTDEGYAVLGQLKGLRDVRLHYMGDGCETSKDAPLFINQLPLPLKVLEIKHGFKVSGGCMEKLKAQPELIKLEIDTGYAGSAAVGFIEHSPKLENLQIHRTTMTDQDLQRIFAACPDLKILLLRPSGQKANGENRITGRSLRGLQNCKQLEHLVLGTEWNELPWEDCFQVLAGLPNLKQLQLEPSDIADFSPEHPALQKLMKARPDITIKVKGKTIGGESNHKWKQEDTDWNWDDGVTTHG
jgi:hypothetical protein